MHREYNVIVHKGVDLAELEEQLCGVGGTDAIPDREVQIVDPRPGSKRITSFLLDDNEIEQLKQDPRILDVEIPPEQQDGIQIGHHVVTNQVADFQRGGTANADLVNWGLRRGIESFNPYGGSTTVTGDYTYSRDGTGVDIVIMDSGIQADHPDFEDADGNSRVRQIDWYEASGVVGTMPNGFYTDYEGHGTHCAGIAAGKTYGWAKNADIYALKLAGLQGPTDPNSGISASVAFDLIRLWHIRKNDPLDPIYTGRPTVVNMSWGYFYSNTNDPDFGVYRGSGWAYGDPGYENSTNLWINTGIVTTLGGTRYLPGTSSTSDAECSDLVDAGVIVTIAAGNNYYKNVLSGDVEYNNSVTWGGTTRYYHRTGSPWDDNAFYVGNVDEDQQFDSPNYLDRVDASSTRGPAVNIWAPGRDIMSTSSNVTDGYTLYNYPANTSFSIARIGGTSMAAPQVAGIAALHLQGNRNLSVLDMKTRLITEDSSNVMYNTGSDVDYNNYIVSLLGSSGNVIYSRYNIDVNETVSNVVVNNISVTTQLNIPANIDLKANVSNIAVTNFRSFTVTSPPANGNVSISDPVQGILSYVPDNGYSGSDSFTYTVDNTLGNVSNSGTVNITVTGDIVVTLANDLFTVTNDGTTTLLNVLANDDIANANIQTVNVTVSANNGTTVVHANGNISYTPNTAYSGNDSFSYTCDSITGFTSDPATVSIYVNQPVAVKNFTANVDTALGTAFIPVLEKSTSYDPHFANVKALYNFSGGYNDSVSNLGDITPVGTSINLINTGSEHDLDGIYFGDDSNHTGASIAASNLATSNFFTGGDWTVEWSFWKSGSSIIGTQSFFCGSGTNYGPLRCFLNGSTMTVLVANGSGYLRNIQGITGHTFNAWNKVAIQRRGEAIDVFINGVLASSSDSGLTLAGMVETNGTVYIGRDAFSTSTYLMNDCYMDNIRLTQGVARYPISGYDVAEQAFPASNSELANVSTLTIAKQPSNGTAVVSGAGINYTANIGFIGTDYLEYNVTSVNPTTSGNANVELIVTSSTTGIYSNILVSPASIDEDGSTVTFTVNTVNVLDSTTVGYTISGANVTVDDISLGSLTGTIVINSNVGVLAFDVLADKLTEGVETLTVTLDSLDSAGDNTGNISNSVILNDTSLTVTYDSAQFNLLSSDEDSTDLPPTNVIFTVNTSNVTDGTNVAFTISGTGITVDDISLSSLTGNITINGDTGNVWFNVIEDNLTEGNETLTLTLASVDSDGNSTGGLSDTILLYDTSLTPATYDAVYFNLPTVNEDGTTLVTFTVESNNVINGTTVGYTISGANITVSDISLVSLTGTFTINNDTANLSFTVNSDSFTEGPETLTITLDATDTPYGNPTGSLANSIILNDTSTSPVPGTPTYNTVSWDAPTVDEDGDTIAIFNVYTTDVAPGTVCFFTISGSNVTTDDISLSFLTGNITIVEGNTGQLAFTVNQDFITEGNEVLTCTLDQFDENGDDTGNLSANLILVDTSRTPIYSNVTFNVPSITENNTDQAIFTVNTIDVAINTTVGYSITGVTEDDISVPLTGNITINNVNYGLLVFTALEDANTDGNMVATVTLDSFDSFGTPTGNLSANILIIDTSKTPNVPPIANDVFITTPQSQEVVINLSGEISDSGPGAFINDLVIVTPPSDGVANISFTANVEANITYTPDFGFLGNDTILYLVTDNEGANSNVATITITVLEGPDAVDDFVVMDQNTSTVINIVANDVIGDANLDLTLTNITSVSANANVVNNFDGTITYTPNPLFFGNDIVNYTITDTNNITSLPANIYITVNEVFVPSNQPPIANDDTVFVNINSSVIFNALSNDVDTDGIIDPTTLTIVQDVVNGNTILYANGFIRYTPTIGFGGNDSIIYNVADDEGAVSNNANITIRVLTAPIAVDDNVNVIRNTVTQIFVPGNDIEVDANIDLGSVVIESAPTKGLAFANPTTGYIQYTPDTNYVGPDSFTYSIADINGLISGPATVNINVIKPPIPPVFDISALSLEAEFFGQVIDSPVDMEELSVKLSPEIDIQNRNFNIGYYYNNPVLLYSGNKKPQVKWVGYNPSVYPRRREEDKIPIKWSDFLGYQSYFQAFPAPRIRNVSDLVARTGYTNDTDTARFTVDARVDWRESEWPVPPRASPSEYTYKRSITVYWYRNDTLIQTSGTPNGSSLSTSLNVLPGSDVTTDTIKAEIVAILYGPDDRIVNAIKNDAEFQHAKASKNFTTTYNIVTYQPSAPVVQVKPIKTNQTDSHVISVHRRLVDDSLVKVLDNVIGFENDEVGYTATFDIAPGRNATEQVATQWQRKAVDGEWETASIYLFGTDSTLTDSLGNDGLGSTQDYNGHEIRYRARGIHRLENPTSKIAGDWAYTDPITLQYLTEYYLPAFTVTGTTTCAKGGEIEVKFTPYNMGSGTTTYYWRLVPDGVFANEFVTQSGSVDVAENLYWDNSEPINDQATITSVCAIGDAESRDYFLEFYLDAAYTGDPLTVALIETTALAPSYEVRAEFIGTNNKKYNWDVDTSEIFVKEGFTVDVTISIKNLPYKVGDNLWLENYRDPNFADATSPDDIYLRKNSSEEFIKINSGNRFTLECSEVDTSGEDYVSIFKVQFKGESDAIDGGTEGNFEKFIFTVYDASFAGTAFIDFAAKIYDRVEFFFAIRSELEAQEVTYYTTNNVLTTRGDGYVKWKSYDIDTNTGQNDHYFLNPGAGYTLDDYTVTYFWERWNGSTWTAWNEGTFDWIARTSSVSYLGGDGGDEGFYFSNIGDTVQIYDWAEGIDIRQNIKVLLGTKLLINEYSNTVKMKINVENTKSSKGITSIGIESTKEGSTPKLYINTFQMVGKKVRVQLTNNNLYFTNTDFEVTIEKNIQAVNLDELVLQNYHNATTEETVTVTDISGTAVPNYTERTLNFSITQADITYDGVYFSSYRPKHDSTTLKTAEVNIDSTIGTYEGGKFRLKAYIQNLPAGTEVWAVANNFSVNGSAVAISEIGNYIDISNWTGTTDGKPYVVMDTAYNKTGTLSKADKEGGYYISGTTISSIVRDTDSQDYAVRYKVVIPGGPEFNAGVMTYYSYLPEPWQPSDGDMLLVARPTGGGVYEDGTRALDGANDNYIPGALYFTASANGTAPAGTTVYWRINSNSTAVEGTHYSNPNDATLTVNSSGTITQTRNGVRVDKSGDVDTPLYFPVIQDGVYSQLPKSLIVEMSYFSDFSTVFTATNTIVNVDPEPVPKPEFDLSDSFNFGTHWDNASSTPGFFGGDFPNGNEFAIYVNADGTIQTKSGSKGTLTTDTVWLPAGANASDYEWKFDFKYNDTDLAGVTNFTYIQPGQTGALTLNAWYDHSVYAYWYTNSVFKVDDYTPATATIFVTVRHKTQNNVLDADNAVLYFTSGSGSLPTDETPVDETPSTPDDPPADDDGSDDTFTPPDRGGGDFTAA